MTTKKKNSTMVETNMTRLKQDMELLLKTLKQVVGNSPLCFVLLNLDSWGTERKELNEIREFLVKFNQHMNDDCRCLMTCTSTYDWPGVTEAMNVCNLPVQPLNEDLIANLLSYWTSQKFDANTKNTYI